MDYPPPLTLTRSPKTLSLTFENGDHIDLAINDAHILERQLNALTRLETDSIDTGSIDNAYMVAECLGSTTYFIAPLTRTRDRLSSTIAWSVGTIAPGRNREWFTWELAREVTEFL